MNLTKEIALITAVSDRSILLERENEFTSRCVSYYPIILLLSYYPIILLSYYLIILLSYYLIILLSYYYHYYHYYYYYYFQGGVDLQKRLF